MDNLEQIAEQIRSGFEAKNSARDGGLAQSRALIRHCANTIRAIHREEWPEAAAGLETVREATSALLKGIEHHPDIYQSGYIQDALKEVVEAFTIHALVRGEDLPTPESLNVSPEAYLNGLCEAASELRRAILDIIRHDHSDKAERLLDAMDHIYNILMTFDYPDAITGGLRHRVDSLRAVLERTRGDLTNSLRQQKLQAALSELEQRLGIDSSQPPQA
jgi:translin